jgi:hypothetical protein
VEGTDESDFEINDLRDFNRSDDGFACGSIGSVGFCDVFPFSTDESTAMAMALGS